jgi:hypothetical protein
VDRLIADTLPPGWTARHSRYLTEIAGPDGTSRGFTYIGAGDERPLLIATDLATLAPTRTVWDLSNPTSPGGFQAWLARITARCGAVARPPAR